MLNSVPADDEPSSLDFAGSSLVVVASSKEEVLDILKQDVYAQNGVWDVDNVSFLLSSFIRWPIVMGEMGDGRLAVRLTHRSRLKSGRSSVP